MEMNYKKNKTSKSEIKTKNFIFQLCTYLNPSN